MSTKRQRHWARGAGKLFVAMLAAVMLATSAAAEDNLRRPIQVSADGHFLAASDGSPFFWLADTGWLLFSRLTREEADLYLRERAEQGFTVIQAVAPGMDVSLPNRYGELPFINADATQPNPRYFEHVDWVLQRAARYRLRIALLPVWGGAAIGGFLGNGSNRLLTPDSARSYGYWLGRRYRDNGVIWVLGGDTNPVGITAFSLDPALANFALTDYRPIYDALARGLAEGEGRSPVISFHISCCSWPGTPEPRTSLYLGTRDWLTINMIQSSHFRDAEAPRRRIGFAFAWDGRFNYVPIRDEYNALPVRPVIDSEARYEDLAIDIAMTPEEIARKGYWQAYDTRNAAYHAVFAGAAGHTFGNHSVWQFYNPALGPPIQAARADLSWQAALARPGAGQMRHLRALMLSRPYFSRIPDESVIVGEGGEGEAHIGATRDRTGAYIMIYLPRGQDVTVDLSNLSGLAANAWWYDPRTGAAAAIDGDHPTNRRELFSPPSSGADQDWVLVLDDASRTLAPPGAPRAYTR